jgi:hypothetical protein
VSAPDSSFRRVRDPWLIAVRYDRKLERRSEADRRGDPGQVKPPVLEAVIGP